MEDDIYHACRVAFVMGEEGVPWDKVCDALRAKLCPEFATNCLQESDYKEYPMLRELMERLASCTNRGVKHWSKV